MKRCPYCVEKMQDVAVVCPHCGRDYPQTTTEERAAILATKKTDTWVRYLLAGIVVMLLVLSGWIFWYIQSAKSTAALQGVQADVSGLSAQLTAVSVENRQLSDRLSTPQPVQVTENPLNESLAREATAQATEIVGLQTQVHQLQQQSQRLCQGYGELKFDYTNNETLFAQLKEYAKGLGGEITKATYVLPWTDPSIAIYTINTEISGKPFTFIFIGYFENEKLNLKNAIYWIGNDCYLDR